MRWMIGVILLAACSSAEEKARERELAMIEQAKADSTAEADFIGDSVRLAASFTVDTIRELRIRDVTEVDDDGDNLLTSLHQAVAPNGQVCALTPERYPTVVRGDTLTCQWGPPP